MAEDLSAALRSLSLSTEDDAKSITYLQQLAASNEYFPVKFGGAALKNCDNDGVLLSFKSKTEAAKSKPWLYLPIKLFNIQVCSRVVYLDMKMLSVCLSTP